MQKNDMEIDDLYVIPSYVHNRKATPQWQLSDRTLPSHNLVYLYGGKGIFTWDGEVQSVKAGDLVYFPEGCHRSMQTDPMEPLMFYTVNFQAVQPLYIEESWSIRPVSFPFPLIKSIDDTALHQRFMTLFERLHQNFLTGKNRQKAKLRETLLEILSLAAFAGDENRVSYSSRRKAQQAAQYMAAHYREKLTLSSLSAAVGLSPSHFSAIFRAATGYSPIDYLISLRIFQAKQLLRDGYSVTKVAEAVGFSDIYYFSNTFKRVEGIAPGHYRNALKQEEKDSIG